MANAACWPSASTSAKSITTRSGVASAHFNQCFRGIAGFFYHFQITLG